MSGLDTQAGSAARRQRGVVLVLSLILLVVISLVAIAAVRGSISGEQVSRNLRTNAAAAQAAETALRLCEDDVLSGSPTFVIIPLSITGTNTMPQTWRTRSNWSDATLANVLTTDIVNSADDAARTLPVMPRCMIEEYPLLTLQGGVPRQSYLITSIGYSADYRVNGSNQLISGSEVWLQSILRRP
ncbi:MAG: PilX N-terminal domain-containing pilus assembly protein [Burkholderiaceae bacterium]|nr:PilX N-terminal domain-containing pilus assembly protein [Burkholderiaceae bacterium]MDO9090976.1 PilX N-terminal domain-containing pilus assembly protein [Burkholderiaceae bacterium]